VAPDIRTRTHILLIIILSTGHRKDAVEWRIGSRYQYLAYLTAWEVGLPLWIGVGEWMQGTARVPCVSGCIKWPQKSLASLGVWMTGVRDGCRAFPNKDCNFFGEQS